MKETLQGLTHGDTWIPHKVPLQCLQQTPTLPPLWLFLLLSDAVLVTSCSYPSANSAAASSASNGGLDAGGAEQLTWTASLAEQLTWTASLPAYCSLPASLPLQNSTYPI